MEPPPAVAYNVPGLRDSVKHMKTGILVPYGYIASMAKVMVILDKKGIYGAD